MLERKGSHSIVRVTILTLTTCLFVTGCASTFEGLQEDFSNLVDAGPDPKQEEQQEVTGSVCENNFSVSGSFFSGKQYTSYQDFTGLSESRAFKNVAQYLATKSWTIVNTDADLGIITATQGVVGSEKTKDLPLNILVKELSPDSVRVQASLSLSPGLMTSEDGQKKELCAVIEAAFQ